ncbi:FAD-binding oxidoreductase [Candidatus Jorgensenbacteria bacterium]|nr:FAD-binding oxidoreductase [Candidatus Jorgensenbacteria bacterium]
MIIEAIKKFLHGDVLTDETTLQKYSHDTSLFEIKPEAVVFPKDSSDIKGLVRFVRERRAIDSSEKIYLTPRSAGSDMTGGPLGESLVLDFTKYFNHILEIGDLLNSSGGESEGYALVEPGVFYRDFDRATREKDYFMPSYPASRELCAVGGMTANDAGGEKTLAYGKTHDYVMQLKVVLSDGEECVLKPLTKKELEEKMQSRNFEGETYRKMYDLLERNYDTVKAAKPRVSKNSAGYNLWDVWDRQTFDLTKLFVGSQGTLGIITEIKFRLVRPKKHSALLIIFLKDMASLAKVVLKVLTHKPESFESYDDHTLKIAVRYFTDMLKIMGARNVFSLALQFLPEFFMMLSGGVPKLILEAEFTGDSEEEIYKKARAAEKDLYKSGVKTRIAKDDREEQKYWTIRRESFNLLRHHVHGKQTAPFIDDIVVRPELLPEFLPKLNAIMNQYDLTYTIAGHIGNGNFHIIPLMNLKDQQSKKIILELSEKVYQLVIEFQGSIDGEHNDGLIRSPYLEKMFGKEVYKLFEETKQIFDPLNIFNPGKKVHSDLAYALAHLKRE